MSLEGLKSYWRVWASKQDKGDPFFFFGNKKGEGEQEEEDKGEDKKKKKKEEEEEEEEDKEETHSRGKKISLPASSTPEFDIDRGVPQPCQCDTPALRTLCLQQLVSKLGAGSVFHKLTKQVDALKVSPVSIIKISLTHEMILGHRSSQWISELTLGVHQMVMG